MEDLLLTRRVFESDEPMGPPAAEDAGALLREATAARGQAHGPHGQRASC